MRKTTTNTLRLHYNMLIRKTVVLTKLYTIFAGQLCPFGVDIDFVVRRFECKSGPQKHYLVYYLALIHFSTLLCVYWPLKFLRLTL